MLESGRGAVGSARGSGLRGRLFESGRPDQRSNKREYPTDVGVFFMNLALNDCTNGQQYTKENGRNKDACPNEHSND